MAFLWRYVRGLFAGVGSDPYYASYERSLSNIKGEVQRLQVGAGGQAGALGPAHACGGWVAGQRWLWVSSSTRQVRKEGRFVW